LGSDMIKLWPSLAVSAAPNVFSRFSPDYYYCLTAIPLLISNKGKRIREESFKSLPSKDMLNCSSPLSVQLYNR
jgi:hypothetical protein